jgi:hypothetical protein
VRALLALLAALGRPTSWHRPWSTGATAGERAGQVVTVEGDVREAECSEDRCVLEFAPEDARGFRVVVLMAMFSRAADAPDVTYRGRRIRATGKVQRFQGRVEMVLRGTGQIELADTGRRDDAIDHETDGAAAHCTTAHRAPTDGSAATLPHPRRHPRRQPRHSSGGFQGNATAGATAPPPSAPSSAAPTPLGRSSTATTGTHRARRSAGKGSFMRAGKGTLARDGQRRAHTHDRLERCLRALPYRCPPGERGPRGRAPLLDEAERQVDEACR